MQKKIESGLREGKLVIGYKNVLAAARKGQLDLIVVSKTSGLLKDKVEKLASVKTSDINLTSKELGILCKKAFNIAVLGVKR